MTRTNEAHETDKATLQEALEFFAQTLDKNLLVVAASHLLDDRSVYHIQDPDWTEDHGYVVKTRTLWVYKTAEGRVFRSSKADLIAIRAL